MTQKIMGDRRRTLQWILAASTLAPLAATERVRAAQASVVRLIATCRRETAAASAAERGSLRFDGFQQLDMNTAMAGSRRAEGHTRAATAAQERATALLAGVPDPGNTLRDQINGCDQSSD